MKILITGGTGFLGTPLSQRLLARGDELTLLTRNPQKVFQRHPNQALNVISELKTLTPQDFFDVVINLAGEPVIDKRWGAERKQQLRESRITITQQLVAWMASAEVKPSVLISGSATGIYGDCGDEVVTEQNALRGDGFGVTLCREWEQAAQAVTPFGVRLAIVRTGLVLGRGGGLLAPMLLPFRLGLGCRLGSGRQWMPWIHIDDYLTLFIKLIDSPHLSGVFNATAPNPVTNADFTQSLAKQLNRPAWFVMPTPLLNLIMGSEMAHLLLTGQKVIPARWLAEGFNFTYSYLGEALQAVLAPENA